MKYLAIFLLVSILLTSCSSIAALQVSETPTPPSTATSVPTFTLTPLPTHTITPTRTSTPKPTSTFTPEPTVTATAVLTKTRVMGEEVVVLEGGYSFRTPVGFKKEVEGSNAILSTSDFSIVIMLSGATNVIINLTPKEIAENFIYDFTNSGPSFVLGEPVPKEVNDVSGVMFPLIGDEMSGQIFILQPDEDTIFFSVGIWETFSNPERWEKRGKEAMQSILENVTFLD
jgi:hypothetical protein